MSNTCFICATPYQIIAAISIVSGSGKDADMYILPHFSNPDEYAIRIRDLNLFSEVKVVDTSEIEAYKRRNNRLLYGLGVVHNYLRINKIVRLIVGKAVYNKIYISTHLNIGRLICIYYMKRGADVCYFDDGEGSYVDSRIYEASGIDRIIRRFFFGRETVELSKNRQLYCPDLFKKVFGDAYIVSSIPNWSKDDSLLRCINTVCGYTDDARINHRFILLDTIPSESFDFIGQQEYEKIVDICVNRLGKELLIKRHPRDNRNKPLQCDVYRYNSIPFEVICANSDIQEKILICSGSSAVLTPKMLFDSEPTVILLHHITGGTTDANKRECFIESVRDLYRDKSRFIIPDTMNEFVETISVLASKNK